MSKRRELVRCTDAAQHLRNTMGVTICARTVRDWVKSKKIRGKRIGNIYYVERSAIDELKKAG